MALWLRSVLAIGSTCRTYRPKKCEHLVASSTWVEAACRSQVFGLNLFGFELSGGDEFDKPDVDRSDAHWHQSRNTDRRCGASRKCRRQRTSLDTARRNGRPVRRDPDRETDQGQTATQIAKVPPGTHGVSPASGRKPFISMSAGANCSSGRMLKASIRILRPSAPTQPRPANRRSPARSMC